MESPNDHLNSSTSTRHRRKSAFVEVGLVENKNPHNPSTRPRKALRFNSQPDIFEYTGDEASDSEPEPDDSDTPSTASEDYDQDLTLEAERLVARRAELRQGATMYRLSVAGLVLAILVPLMHGSPWLGSAPAVPGIGVKGGPLRRDPAGPIFDPVMVEKRDDSPTDFCFRWAQMTAVVNGTMYIYGGQAAAKSESAAGTWNNDFLTLDLTSNWSIASAPLTGLAQPSGPPNVSLGALWNSYDSLFLYGGEFSSDPPETPTPYSLWEYQIAQSKWVEHQNPQTSAGQFSTDAGIDVGRAAEGAAIAVPALGRAWYFGGHQDAYTTPDWSVQVWRIYLTSLLEFTFPGRTNDQVTSLENGATAGSDGAWRNITSGGLQTTNGFPERADGLLIYVPGYGPEGILVGLAGGTNDTFQQMSQLDIYDIANSKWYKQATSGPTPGIRVNPCAVIATAPDGSTQNIYMFGGQNLQPAGAQTQYNDMWILTIPSFTWIQVDQTNQAVPSARAGHTCNAWNAQMVVVGGYVSPELSCDSPGVYVFDMSNLEWKTTYNTLSGNADGSPQNNPLNQQPAQFGTTGDKAGLQGSFGYSVPPAVVSVVGGNAQGGATVTAPAVIPTDGPLKSGQPIIYTSSTSTATPGATGSVGGAGSSSSSGVSADGHSGASKTSVGAIVAGVVAGVLALVVAYLAFCLWLYRRRLALYKRHLDMARASWGSAGETTPFAATGYLAAATPNKDDGENSPFATSQAERVDSRDGSRQSGQGSGSGSGSASERPGARDTSGSLRRSSVEDLIAGGEPSFWGTMLSPKRSLRVTNRD